MNSAWPTVKLQDLCEAVQYGFTASAGEFDDGPRLLRITDIVPGQINWTAVPRCEIESKNEEKYLLKTGDIVVARTGATVGYAKLIRNPPRSVFASYLVRFRINNENDARYVGKVVESIAYKEFVRKHAGGAAQPNANAQVLGSYPIPLPPRNTQERIANILCAYDDLIENNTRRIAILDEMARRIFEEWFVYFRAPGCEGLPLVKSAIGPIPCGWEAVTIDDVTRYVNRGIAPKYAADGPSVVINQKCIRGGALSLDVARRQEKSVPEEKLIKTFDVLINSTGVGTLGRVAQVMNAPENCTVDSHVTISRPSAEEDPEFFGLSLLRLESVFSRLGVGSTNQTELQRERIRATPYLRPPVNVQRRFGKIAGPVRKLAHTLAGQNANLRAQRDLLLPNLISGEIDVLAASTRLKEAAE